ncbi:MAG: hypothetical protein A2X86_19600 [Bdellovibrionales bacterium GWA2_49_15]|nr:MAG: hypothetical protein A2X86_19600 [Bdellovibrionales bacterium GWA2_49_15]HAZ13803.1 hypothetical protein [Bdellovibrionales bacterium]
MPPFENFGNLWSRFGPAKLALFGNYLELKRKKRDGAQERIAWARFSRLSNFAKLVNVFCKLNQQSVFSFVVRFRLFLAIFGDFSAKLAPKYTFSPVRCWAPRHCFMALESIPK